MISGKTGYSPSIGRLLSMMEYTRRTTLEAAEGLSVEELDYRINGKGNSIGCLLYHIASVEEIYQIFTFENREPSQDEWQKLGVGVELGEKTHKVIKGRELHFYKEKLLETRKRTLELFKHKEDRWLDEISPLNPVDQANYYFCWFHVFEDELNHRGQIRLIRNHQKKGEGS
ncbi:DinB family protein [Halobacillus sp. A5]|nr:DinB family protein [Halobacillus sp. A5]MCP3027103.1 DinB family protein [Halobacillus sp. A5]